VNWTLKLKWTSLRIPYKNVVSKKAKKEVIASKELEVITAWDATANISAYIRDENAKRPEDNDK